MARSEEVLRVTEQQDRCYAERDEQGGSTAVTQDPRRNRERDGGQPNGEREGRDGFRKLRLTEILRE